MNVVCRIGRNGLHFIDADGGSGEQFVLSHEQVKLLACLWRYHSEERQCLRSMFFYGQPYPKRRRPPLTNAQRASYSRSLRRLEAQGYIIRKRKTISLSPEGAELLQWLLNEWDGMSSYLRHFASEWGERILSEIEQPKLGRGEAVEALAAAEAIIAAAIVNRPVLS